MAASLTSENFVLHKLQSLTGIIPVGFYMLQHLTLNSFAIAGPDKFNAVIGFFEGMPFHLLLLLEICLIWIPLLFHAVYGTFIAFRAQPNYIGTKYRWSQNRMFVLQRITGLIAFAFLIVHVITTTGATYWAHAQGAANPVEKIQFAAWHDKLTTAPYLWTLFYLIGVLACSYHLSYGVWNFSIRWGLAISERAQIAVQKFSFWMFIVVTILGWSALVGFLLPQHASGVESQTAITPVSGTLSGV
jgi:succinate dehydrogenase / fumarate reductase cytochrome b subunit